MFIARLLSSIIVISCVVKTATVAQELVTADTLRAQRATNIEIPFEIRDVASTGRVFVAELHLSNATVFRPTSILHNGNTLQDALVRVNDSLYTIRVSIDQAPTSVYRIFGPTLSGNDSLCILLFSSIQVDSVALGSRSLLLISSDSSTFWRSYYRFASVSEAFPNPSYDGEAIRWTVRVDEPSDLDCLIYDALGRLIKFYRVYAPVGSSEFVFVPDEFLYPGSYELHIRTSTGEAKRRFVVLR